MRSILFCTLVLAVTTLALRAQESAMIRTADGFQCPVGPNGTGEGYYIARGYMPNGHLGDDWNGIKGGDTDFGDPVYATAYGLVVFAKNYHVGWGNVVILRHAYYEGSILKFADSLYGHLNDFLVHEGQQVRRGQLLGHIGNNNGMYDAHLHFELRKNINIGMFRGSYPRDFTNYFSPNQFLASHPTCPRGDKIVAVPINTFPAVAPPSYVAAKVTTPVYSPGTAPADHLPPVLAASRRPGAAAPVAAAPEPEVVTAPPPSLVKVVTPTTAKVVAATSTPVKSSTPAAKSAAASASAAAKPTVVIASPSKAPTATSGKAPPAAAPIAKANRETETALTEIEMPKSLKTDAKNSALESDGYEPPSTTAADGPIRRSTPKFRVDRFQDLRGLGY